MLAPPIPESRHLLTHSTFVLDSINMHHQFCSMHITAQLSGRAILCRIASILLLFSAPAHTRAITLEAGQQFLFEFTSISNSGPTVPMDRSRVIAWFEPGSYGLGDTASLEIFADSLADTPLTNAIGISQYPDREGLVYSWLGFGPTPPPVFFPDLQGVLRVTMITGSADLNGFEVSQIIDGQTYSEYFTVPEPTSTVLMSMFLVWAALNRSRRNQFARCEM